MDMTAADRRESLDAYRPAEIARLVRAAGTEKAALPLGPLVTRAVLAGKSGLLVGDIGETTRRAAGAKLAPGPAEAFSPGILCNALVCLAIWLTFSARTAAGKTIVIILPVAGFVALGFEHLVANLALLPLGRLAGADVGLVAAQGNLVQVTLGNIVGGGGGVALAYRFAYPERLAPEGRPA